MMQWMYLTDLAPKARILNLTTGEIREIMQTAVKDRAPIGLRRYLLEELPGGLYRETGAVAELTSQLVEDMQDMSIRPNSWNFDFADYAFEASSDPAELERVRARLQREMADYPYKFEITGLQRRFLLYFSDGNYESQQAFQALLPTPDTSPLRTDGTLRRPFAWTYNHLMRDAKAPFPRLEERLYGGLRPCLYRGPAYVVRFLLDDQDVLLERCRVYVDPEGNFICSDWCQRHDFSSYNNGGINLQMGIYTFATWVTGPCLAKNGGHFTPKNATFARSAVRDLMKKHVLVPTFDDTLAKATKKIAAVSKALPPKPVVPVVGPITADSMAEALAAAEKIFAAKAAPADPVEAPPKAELPPNTYRVPAIPEDDDYEGYLIQYTTVMDINGCPVVQAARLYAGNQYRTLPTAPPAQSHLTAMFIVDERSPTSFWYGSQLPDFEDEDDDVESLNQHWWLGSAAAYYRDHLILSPVETALLES